MTIVFKVFKFSDDLIFRRDDLHVEIAERSKVRLSLLVPGLGSILLFIMEWKFFTMYIVIIFVGETYTF